MTEDSSTMLEEVTGFLLRENLLLTALELRQELLERGKDQSQLRDFFLEMDASASTQEPSSGSSSCPSTPSRGGGGNSVVANVSSEHTRRIAQLEYELSVAREDLEAATQANRVNLDRIGVLERQSSGRSMGAGSGGPSAASSSQDSLAPSASADDVTPSSSHIPSEMEEPITAEERTSLLSMVRDFLQVANLKMTAISLTEEAGEMDGAALAADSQGTSMTLSLVYLLRYFGMPSVRQQAQETMSKLDQVTKRLQKKSKELNVVRGEYKQLKSENEALQRQLEEEHRKRKHQEVEFRRERGEILGLEEMGSPTVANNPFVSESAQEFAKEIGIGLGKLIPGVAIEKRADLVPLILSALSRLSEGPTKQELTASLFNLFRKPSKSQREMIVAAFVQLAESSRMDTLETDLFPEICNQVDHAVAERRALVAETCGSLCHFVKPELRSTLVLPVLKELVQDESDMVRELAVINLSILIEQIEGTHKTSEIFHTSFPLLSDASTLVRNQVDSLLFRSIFKWCKKHNCLLEVRDDRVMSPTHKSPGLLAYMLYHLKTSAERLGQEKEISDAFSLPLLGCLGLLESWLPDIVRFTLLTVPQEFKPEGTDSPLEDSQVEDLKFEEAMEVLQKWLPGALAHMPAMVQLWPILEFMQQIANSLVQAILEIPTSRDFVHNTLAKTVFNICKTFGPCFAEVIVNPLYQEHMEAPGNKKLSKKVRKERNALLKSYLAGPIYLSGHENVSLYVERCLDQMAEKSSKLWDKETPASFIDALKFLCRLDPTLEESILAGLRRQLVTTNKRVRFLLLDCLAALMMVVSDSCLSSRVVPALITVGMDDSSQCGVLRGMCNALSHVDPFSGLVERITTVISQILEQGEFASVQEFLDTVAHMLSGGELHADIRDSYLLPQLIQYCYQVMRLKKKGDRKKRLASLINCYRAVLGCSLDGGILPPLIKGLDELEACSSVLSGSQRKDIQAISQELLQRMPREMLEAFEKDRHDQSELLLRGLQDWQQGEEDEEPGDMSESSAVSSTAEAPSTPQSSKKKKGFFSWMRRSGKKKTSAQEEGQGGSSAAPSAFLATADGEAAPEAEEVNVSSLDDLLGGGGDSP